MILADRIIDERKKAGWSQEELAAKLGVSRQAVSKWEGAQATPDLQRIVQMAGLFGVTTDYLLREDCESAAKCDDAPFVGESVLRMVSLQEAQDFLELKDWQAPRIALGVALCITSPVAMLVFSGMLNAGAVGLADDAVVAAGMIVLLLMVAAAVFLFVTSGMRGRRFEHFEREPFETAYGVTGMVGERKQAFEGAHSMSLAVGIVLCIVSVVPMFFAVMLGLPDSFVCFTVAVLLALVAVGVYMIVRSGIINGSFQMLLQEGDYTKTNKRADRKLAPLAGGYWCLVVAIYLWWSFSTMSWERTWIIWPVAAVLFAGLYALAKGIVQSKDGE